jgi:hypothetical protein
MIKFERIAHYQFSFFSPSLVVEPSPQIISKFMTAFTGTDFMPTTIPVFHVGPVPETRQMLNFFTANTGWRIEFEPNRIAFNKTPVPNHDIGKPEDFFKEISDFCARVLSVLEINGTRLAFVTKGILHEMNPDQIRKIYFNLFNPPKFYTENDSIEWFYRNAVSIESKNIDSEKFNVINDINYLKILEQEGGVQKELPRIEIGFDINTTQKNTKQRFGLYDIEPFLSEASGLMVEIMNDIEIKIL